MWSTGQLHRRRLPLRDSISDLLLRFPVRSSRLLSSSLEKHVHFFFFSRLTRLLSIGLLGTTIVLQSLEFATFFLQPAVIYLLEYLPSQVLEFGVDLVCNHCWRTNASYRSHLSTFFPVLCIVLLCLLFFSVLFFFFFRIASSISYLTTRCLSQIVMRSRDSFLRAFNIRRKALRTCLFVE